jgi:hypothetical protein
MSCQAIHPYHRPDWGKLNGPYRARLMVCQPSPNMARLMLWAGPGLLPVVLGQMVWAKFSGLLEALHPYAVERRPTFS